MFYNQVVSTSTNITTVLVLVVVLTFLTIVIVCVWNVCVVFLWCVGLCVVCV